MKIDWIPWLICISNLSLYVMSSEPFSDFNLFVGAALFGILAKETAAQYRKSKET